MSGNTLQLTITALQKLKNNVLWVTLSPPAGIELPPWTPGAHIGVHISDNLIRQYSLCGDSNDQTVYRIAVKLDADSRGGSEYIHAHWCLGETVTVESPRNNFELVDASSYLFVAGGIGITPLLPMIKQADEEGRSWRAVYRGRERQRMPFANAMKRAYGDLVEILASDEGQRLSLKEIVGDPVPGRAVYCCGPSSMMDEADELSRAAERSNETFHLERFVNDSLEGHTDLPFELELARTGRTLQVPADKSIIDVMQEEGMQPDFSCREGTCGTCETDVLEGEVDHRDTILDEDERAANDCMFICVSRCKGARLVVDL